MSKVSLWVRIPVKPGTRAAAAKAFQFAVDNVQNEAGTLTYIVLEEEADPDAIFVFEVYSDHDALAAHGGSDWFKEFGPMLAGFAAGKPEMHFLNPLLGKGL
ncbi:MAG: putative quinol monooxygenase [Actinomycetota bacterium]|nr:putative quinol monooxygenase [Actinomycetota bacterium]